MPPAWGVPVPPDSVGAGAGRPAPEGARATPAVGGIVATPGRRLWRVAVPFAPVAGVQPRSFPAGHFQGQQGVTGGHPRAAHGDHLAGPDVPQRRPVQRLQLGRRTEAAPGVQVAAVGDVDGAGDMAQRPVEFVRLAHVEHLHLVEVFLQRVERLPGVEPPMFLDDDVAPGWESLLAVPGLPHRPARLVVAAHAAARIIFDRLDEAEPLKSLLLRRRQAKGQGGQHALLQLPRRPQRPPAALAAPAQQAERQLVGEQLVIGEPAPRRRVVSPQPGRSGGRRRMTWP